VPAPELNLRIALLGAAGFLVAVAWQFVTPVLPVYLASIGYSAAAIGILASLQSLTQGLVESEIGRITAALGQRSVLIAGLVVNAAAMAWIVLARATWGVAGGLIGVGAARATIWSPLHASVAATASEETRGRAFGVFWALTSVAFLTGPAIGAYIAERFGVRSAFFLGGAVSLVTVAIVFTITERTPATREPATTGWAVLRNPIVLRLCLVNHFYNAISAIWSTFLPLYMVRQNLSVVTIGWVFAVQGLTYALVQIPTGRLADRIGPERLLLPGVVGRAAMVLAVPLTHSAGPLLVAAAIFGLTGGTVPVTFTMLVARFSSRDQYTSAMGVYNSSSDLGFFVGPLLGGAAALLGIVAPFLLALPMALAGIFFARTGRAAIERAQENV
jgi:predicted MFS family arabinose efflux permease